MRVLTNNVVVRALTVFLALGLTALFLDFSPMARAATSDNIPLQGKLVTSSGLNLTSGTYDFRVVLYNASSGGSILWQKSFTGKTVTDGIFSLSIGGTGEVGGDLAGVLQANGSDNVYVTICFDADKNASNGIAECGSGTHKYEEAFARMSLAAAPYALVAKNVLALNQLDWAHLADSMVLDATTTIDMDTNSANLNFDNNTLFIDSANNRIGIGTNSPARALHVSGAIRLSTTTVPSSPAAGDIYSDGSKLYYYNGSSWKDLTDTGSSVWTVNGDDIYYNSGMVGIGTTDPQAGLHVEHVAQTSTREVIARFSVSDSDSSLRIENGLTGENSFNPRIIARAVASLSPSLIIEAETNNDSGSNPIMVLNSTISGNSVSYRPILDVQNGGVSQLRIDGDGKVGVGTDAPARKLHVDGAIRLNTTTTPSSPATGDIYSDGSTLYYYNGSSWDDLTDGGGGGGLWSLNGTSAYYNGGNVGIGTDSPSSLLDIASTGNTAITVTSSAADSYPGLHFSNASGYWAMVVNSTTGDFILKDQNAQTTPLRIKAGSPQNSLILDESGNLIMGSTGDYLDMNQNAILNVSTIEVSDGSEDAILFDDGQVRFTVHDGYGHFQLLQGADGDNNCVGAMAGAIEIEMSESGFLYIKGDNNCSDGTYNASTYLTINNSGAATFYKRPVIEGTTPTLKFYDTTTNENSYYLHNNSNRLYFLVDRNNDDAWETPHPLYLEGENAIFGGTVTIANTLYANNGIVVDGQTVIDNGAGWHRSVGTSGWRNDTHLGGWYMQDSTWIRSWNNKAVLINGPGSGTALQVQAGNLNVVNGNYLCLGGSCRGSWPNAVSGYCVQCYHRHDNGVYHYGPEDCANFGSWTGWSTHSTDGYDNLAGCRIRAY